MAHFSDGSSVEDSPTKLRVTVNLKDYLGHRVAVAGGKKGVLRFVGQTEFAKGEWVGVELDACEEGRTDGSVNGVMYFKCSSGHGLFTRTSQIYPDRSDSLRISPPTLESKRLIRPTSCSTGKKRTRRSLLGHDQLFSAVLLNPALMMKIQQYQSGVFKDLQSRYREWRYFSMKHSNFKYGMEVPSRYISFFDKQMHINDLFLPSIRDHRFVLHVAIYEGDLAVVKRCFQCFQNAIESPQAMDCAASFGHLHIIKYLNKNFNHIGCTTAALDSASTHGHLEIVEFLTAIRTEGCTILAMDGASRFGHLMVVEYLHRNRIEGCTCDAMNAAAEYGHLEVVQFLHFNRKEGCTIDAMDFATQNGHFDVVEFLHHHRREGCSVDALNWAAEGGYLELVYFLHDNRHEGATADAMDLAAQNGYLGIVEFLHENRSEGCTTAAMDMAAANGHMDVIEYLYVNRSEGCTPNALIWAAQNGHFEVVQFLWTFQVKNVRSNVNLAIQAARRNENTTIQNYLEFQVNNNTIDLT